MNTNLDTGSLRAKVSFYLALTLQSGVINTYVVEDPTTHEITDLISFYTLPSSILHHPQYKTLNAAYSWYNVSTKTPLVDLMRDALILANKACLQTLTQPNFIVEGF